MVEHAVVEPLEVALTGIRGELYASAEEGRAHLSLVTHTDPSEASAQVLRAVGQVGDLPPDVEPPVVHAIRGHRRTVEVAVHGNVAPTLLAAAARDVATALGQRGGVDRVDTPAIEARRWRVELDPARMSAVGLSLPVILARLDDTGKATLDEAVVGTANGTPVRLSDLATIREVDAAVTERVGGQPSLTVTAHGEPGDIDAALEAVRPRLPTGVQLTSSPLVPGHCPLVPTLSPRDRARVHHVIRITHDDLEVLAAVSQRIADQLGKRSAGSWAASGAATRPQLQVRVDRVAAARLGIATGDVTRTVQAARFGVDVAPRVVRGMRTPAIVFLGAGDPSPDQLLALPLTTANGTVVPLSNVAEIVLAPEPRRIERYQHRRVQYLTTGDDVARADITAVLAELEKPLAIDYPGLSVELVTR